MFIGLLTALSKEGLVVIQNGPDETNTSQLLDSGKMITDSIGVPLKSTHYGFDYFVVENKPDANNLGTILKLFWVVGKTSTVRSTYQVARVSFFLG